jgi:hypothetical protein
LQKKRRFLFIVISLIFLYFLGVFHKPVLEYQIFISLPENVSEMRDITIYLPFPYYRGFPIPYYKGKPIKKIAECFQIACKTKNAKCTLIETKYGKLLKIQIPKLSRRDIELQTNKLELKFPQNFKLSYFFTPLYFFKEPSKIFFLNPFCEKWSWLKLKRENVFLAKREITSIVFADFPKDKLYLKLKFRAKKRIFFGYISLNQEFGESEYYKYTLISKQGWQKIPLKVIEKRKWF